MHIESSSDWAIVRFTKAKMALCQDLRPEYSGLRCLPDAILLNQPLGRTSKFNITLYLYDVPEVEKITTEKGYEGKLILRFEEGGEERVLKNDLQRDALNRKVFEVNLPCKEAKAAGRFPLSPRVFSFYYVWYGNPQGPSGRWYHWDLCGHRPDQGDLASSHTPLLGAYDSKDPQTIAQHIEWARAAGLDGFIVACFGPSSPSWKALGPFVEMVEAKGFAYALSFPFPDYPYQVSPGEAADIVERALKEFYGPLYIRIEGKPVVFFYAAHQISRTFWRSLLKELRRRGIEIFSLGNFLDPSYGEIFDGVYFYLPLFFSTTDLQGEFFRWARALGLLLKKPYFYPIFPGFDNRRACGGNLYVPRRNGKTAQGLLASVVSLRPQWLLVSTFNEWHEGTEFEPSVQFGYFYLHLLSLISKGFRENEPIRR